MERSKIVEESFRNICLMKYRLDVFTSSEKTTYGKLLDDVEKLRDIFRMLSCSICINSIAQSYMLEAESMIDDMGTHHLDKADTDNLESEKIKEIKVSIAKLKFMFLNIQACILGELIHKNNKDIDSSEYYLIYPNEKRTV